MATPRITVFEVLDNFFGAGGCPEANSLSDAQILELRGHIMDFYAGFGFPPRGEYETRLYLGGFLSSPPFTTEAAPYLSSALLCSDSTILFDPLHYWLCDEQYRRERLVSAPSAWRDLETWHPNYTLTRKFLVMTLPWLYGLRPLVDSGIVVLIPAEQVVHAHLDSMNHLASEIAHRLKPVEDLAKSFSPDEITVDDNRKGFFTFAGGDREKQIRKAIGRGIECFSRDVTIANSTDSIYTAPFRWEQHLGKEVLERFAASEYQTSLIEGVRNLRLPILANLSPGVLARIHRDSKYAEFRAGLSDALANIDAEIGTEQFADRVLQIEQDILLPKVEAICRETQANPFKSATKSIVEGFFTFVQVYVANYALGAPPQSNLAASTFAGVFTLLRQMGERIAKSRDHRIWAQLLPEKPALTTYYQGPLSLKQEGAVNWEIDDQPSLKISISKAVLKYQSYA